MKLVRKYICKECNNTFTFTPVIGNIPSLTICVDPAPKVSTLIQTLFSKPRCPICSSSNIKKLE